MPSIVIPAHNEAGVIRRCLHGILRDAQPGEFEIVVVCNGCRDGTAAAVREFGDSVRLIETEVPSKSNALNLGDAVASAFPRFYVDADVVITADSIRRVAAVLDSGAAMAAAPVPIFDVSNSSFLVRSFYRIWTRMPYIRVGMIGSGMYALSQPGRQRFGRFPDIISDDGFARLHFSPDERVAVPQASFVVTAPRRLQQLLQVKTRSHKGLLQLHRTCPELLRNDPRDYVPSTKEIARNPRLWWDMCVYLGVVLTVKLLARWKYSFGGMASWERDDSSRQLDTHPSGVVKNK